MNFKKYERQCYGGNWTDWQLSRQELDWIISTDFNSMKISGTYYAGSAPTGNNKPCSETGVLEVFNCDNVIVTQRYTTYDGQAIYTRGSYRDVWTAWKAWK